MEQEEERQEEAQKEWKRIRQEMDNTMDQIRRKIKEQPRPSDSPNWRKKEGNSENEEPIMEISSPLIQSIQEEENDIPDLISLEENKEDSLIANITGKTWEE